MRRDTTSHLVRWYLRHFEFEVDVIQLASSKYLAPNVISCLQSTGARTEPIEDPFPVAVADIDTIVCTKVRLEYSYQEPAQVGMDNDSLKVGSSYRCRISTESGNRDLL